MPYNPYFTTGPGRRLYLCTEIAAPPEVSRTLHDYAPDIIALLVAEIAIPWGDSASLAAWFLTQHPPSRPFEIRSRVIIINPGKFWRVMRDDICAGPEACGDRRATIERTLKRLYELLYTPAGPGGCAQ